MQIEIKSRHCHQLCRCLLDPISRCYSNSKYDLLNLQILIKFCTYKYCYSFRPKCDTGMKKGLKAWIEIERKHWKKTQALDISSAAARVVPDLLILSDTIVRRSAVDQEDLKSYWKLEKSHISVGDQQFYYLKVFQRLY